MEWRRKKWVASSVSVRGRGVQWRLRPTSTVTLTVTTQSMHQWALPPLGNDSEVELLPVCVCVCDCGGAAVDGGSAGCFMTTVGVFLPRRLRNGMCVARACTCNTSPQRAGSPSARSGHSGGWRRKPCAALCPAARAVGLHPGISAFAPLLMASTSQRQRTGPGWRRGGSSPS